MSFLKCGVIRAHTYADVLNVKISRGAWGEVNAPPCCPYMHPCLLHYTFLLPLPGRLDRKIEFPLPTVEARAHILRIHSRKMNVSSDVNFDELARYCNSLQRYIPYSNRERETEGERERGREGERERGREGERERREGERERERVRERERERESVFGGSDETSTLSMSCHSPVVDD